MSSILVPEGGAGSRNGSRKDYNNIEIFLEQPYIFNRYRCLVGKIEAGQLALELPISWVLRPRHPFLPLSHYSPPVSAA